MIHLQEIGGRRIACWMNNGGVLTGRRTLVFVHGSGADHTNWIQQYTPLKTTYNVVALDLPGHGQSEGPGERTVSAYAAWTKQILDGLGIVKPVLIGHSLGAAICLTFAIRYGDSAAAVVPVGGGLKMPVNPMILEGLRNDPGTVIALAAKFSVAKPNRERLSGTLAESLSRADPETIHGDFSACDDLDITEAVARIRVPVLVICGADDKMTPPSLSQAIRNGIPGAKLVLIEGTGHYVMLENPATFNTAVADFVNSLP